MLFTPSFYYAAEINSPAQLRQHHTVFWKGLSVLLTKKVRHLPPCEQESVDNLLWKYKIPEPGDRKTYLGFEVLIEIAFFDLYSIASFDLVEGILEHIT